MSSMPRTLLPILPGDQEERRYFALFRSRTAPLFAGYFDANFWDRFVPQISHAEPAVHHAVVALASLHEDLDGSTEHQPGSDQFGLKQYNKSLASLNRYLSTANDESVNIVLICCILFVTFESLRGNYLTAGKHLQCGLKILSGSRQDPLNSESRSEEIVSVMVELYVQVKSILDDNIDLCDPTTGAVYVPERFSSPSEARNTLISITSLVFDIRPDAALNLKPLEQAEILSERQAYYLSLLQQWQVGFDDLLSHLSISMDSKDLNGAILLKIHHITISTFLDDYLTHLQCDLDRFLPQFKKIVSLAQSFVEATKETGISSGGHFLSPYMGIIAPLFVVATKCRDPGIRRAAVRLFPSHRREGPWDSRVAAIITERVIAIEEEGLPDVNAAQDVPESSRIFEINLGKIDWATHQIKVVFCQNATKSRGNICRFEETLTWFGASFS